MKNKQSTKRTDEQQAGVNQEPKTPEHVDEPIDEKAEINKLLDEGYSVKQIIDLGFKRRTVYHYAKQRMKPENNPAGGNSPADGTTLGEPASGGEHELMKIGSKDMIPPEAVLEVLHLPQDGDSVRVWRSGVLDGVGLMLLGARYSQLCGAGIADIVKSQLDIMREAKESSKDIAREAAQQAVVGVANIIERQIPKGEPPKDMTQMFVKRIDRMWEMMDYIQTQRMFPGYQADKPPEGWQVKNIPASSSPHHWRR